MWIAANSTVNRHRLLGLSVVTIVLALIALWQWSAQADSPAKATAIASCKEVGKRPAISAQRVYPQMGKLLAGPMVIGCGRTNHEWLQLVAFHTTKETCVELERPRQQSISGGECKANREAWRDVCGAVCIFGVLSDDVGRHSRFRHSIVSGQVPISSDSTEVLASVDGQATAFPVVEARVESDSLLKRLSVTEPFVAFGIVLPKCVSPHNVQLVVADEGHILKRRGLDTFKNPCTAPPLSAP